MLFKMHFDMAKSYFSIHLYIDIPKIVAMYCMSNRNAIVMICHIPSIFMVNRIHFYSN